MDEKILVLEYQDNFADNLSIYAYGKIAEAKFMLNSYWENSSAKRYALENKMKDFKLNYSYISKTRVEEISKRPKYMDYRDFKHKKIKNDKILTLNNFKIDDIELINDKIVEDFEFNNLDFIKNYDILEEISSENSIGLYVNQNDTFDIKYIERAVKRLNKYLKNPKLYIFSKNNISFDSYVPYKILNLGDWREEFYFLRCAKHKIIAVTRINKGKP